MNMSTNTVIQSRTATVMFSLRPAQHDFTRADACGMRPPDTYPD